MLLIGLDTTAAYVTLQELRALPNLGDTAKFTDAELTNARVWFETKFEEHTGMAFVPRSATDRLTGGGSALFLPRWPVRSITAVRSYTSPTVSTAFTAAELADLQTDPSGIVKRYTLGYWPADVEVDYIHGQAAPPEDVKDAALVAIREKLLKDNTGDRGNRHLGVATEGVFVRNTAGPFFNDEVNDVANTYHKKYKLPAMA